MAQTCSPSESGLCSGTDTVECAYVCGKEEAGQTTRHPGSVELESASFSSSPECNCATRRGRAAHLLQTAWEISIQTYLDLMRVYMLVCLLTYLEW